MGEPGGAGCGGAVIAPEVDCDVIVNVTAFEFALPPLNTVMVTVPGF